VGEALTMRARAWKRGAGVTALTVASAHALNDLYAAFLHPLLPRIMERLGLSIALAAVLTGFLRTMLFGVSPLDPLTYLAVVLIFAATALVAVYLPTRAVMRIDPVTTLRAE